MEVNNIIININVSNEDVSKSLILVQEAACCLHI